MVRELLAVLARAALQWALASLLLANGAAFCLIAAAASSLRLGPPCLLCARVHRLLRSSSSSSAGRGQEQEQEEAFRRLLCDAHFAAVARSGSGETGLQQPCSPSDHVHEGTKSDSDKPGGLESHQRVVSIGSEICEQDRGGDLGITLLGRTTSIGSGDGPYVSLFELAPIAALPEDDHPDYDVKGAPHAPPPLPEHEESASWSDVAGGEQEQLTVSGLVAALRAQRRELEAARLELLGERRAKAGLEEQAELDREAARVAMQLVREAEAEKHELRRQLDACRVNARLHHRADGAMDSGCSAAAAAAAPAIRLGRRPSRDVDGELMMDQEQEDRGCTEADWNGSSNDGNNNNYQSLMDFLPGSAYSSSPDLANLLRLYTAEGNGNGNGNGARRPVDEDIITEGEEEMEEEVEVVAVTAAVSGFDGGDGEATGTGVATGVASLPESDGDLAEDEAAG